MEPMTLLSLIPSGISVIIAIMAWSLRADLLAARSHRGSISAKLEKLEEDHRVIVDMLKEHVVDDAHNEHAHADIAKELGKLVDVMDRQREDLIILKTRTQSCLENRGINIPT